MWRKKNKIATTVVEINAIFNLKYLASSVRKGTSAVSAILYVKNDMKVSKIIKVTFLDKSPQKLDAFALNLQFI